MKFRENYRLYSVCWMDSFSLYGGKVRWADVPNSTPYIYVQNSTPYALICTKQYTLYQPNELSPHIGKRVHPAHTVQPVILVELVVALYYRNYSWFQSSFTYLDSALEIRHTNQYGFNSCLKDDRENCEN